MKTIILLACIAATAMCVPMQFLEVERTYLSPLQQMEAGPSHHTSVEYLIPLERQRPSATLRTQAIPDVAPVQPRSVFPSHAFPSQAFPSQAFPSQAFIKHEIPQAPGRASVEVLYPFSGFRGAAPAAPVVPFAPVAPVRSPKADDEEKDD